MQKEHAEGTCSKELSGRASGLNEIGAHYFAGWLISAGFQRPELMMEIEAVLHDMENDRELHFCAVQEATAAHPAAATEILPSPETQTPAIACEESARLAVVAAPPHPLRSPAHPESKPVRRLPFPARLFAAFFPKRRLAA